MVVTKHLFEAVADPLVEPVDPATLTEHGLMVGPPALRRIVRRADQPRQALPSVLDTGRIDSADLRKGRGTIRIFQLAAMAILARG